MTGTITVDALGSLEISNIVGFEFSVTINSKIMLPFFPKQKLKGKKMEIAKELEVALVGIFNSNKRITVLTGAGISAESGIPTFRGPEGYWTVGSEVYQPQEIATYGMFLKNPREVWKWFLYRRGVCSKAQPNAGHQALVEMENLFANRFALVTQNVDGLHLRVGNSMERTYQVHGNLDYMRCSKECTDTLYPIPKDIFLSNRDEDICDSHWQLLACPQCKSPSRPHVLLWDEFYREVLYRSGSAKNVALETELLIIVGTSGATNLPHQIARIVSQQGGLIIDINIEPNCFSNLGHFIQESSGKALPEIVDIFQRSAN